MCCGRTKGERKEEGGTTRQFPFIPDSPPSEPACGRTAQLTRDRQCNGPEQAYALVEVADERALGEVHAWSRARAISSAPEATKERKVTRGRTKVGGEEGCWNEDDRDAAWDVKKAVNSEYKHGRRDCSSAHTESACCDVQRVGSGTKEGGKRKTHHVGVRRVGQIVLQFDRHSSARLNGRAGRERRLVKARKATHERESDLRNVRQPMSAFFYRRQTGKNAGTTIVRSRYHGNSLETEKPTHEILCEV